MGYFLLWVIGLFTGAMLRFYQPSLEFVSYTGIREGGRPWWGSFVGPLFESRWFEPPLLWAAIWTGAVALVWLLRNRSQTWTAIKTTGPAARHIAPQVPPWVGFAALWLGGLIVLLRWGDDATAAVFSDVAGSDLFRFLELIPLTVIWTAIVCFAILFLGRFPQDGYFGTYVGPFRLILTCFIVLIAVCIVANYSALSSVQARVEGLTAARGLADQTVDGLWVAAGELANDADSLQLHLGSYQSGRSTVGERSLSGDDLEQAMRIGRTRYLDPVLTGANTLTSNAQSVKRHADTAVIQVDLAIEAERNMGIPVSASLLEIRGVVNEAKTSAADLADPIAAIDPLVLQLRGTPAEDGPDQGLLDDLSEAIADIGEAARTTRVNAGVAGRSFDGVDFNDVSMFMWVSALYAALVLFPWVLLLLFLYRKRDDRAVQIIEDLSLLDATGGLLSRALGPDATARPQGSMKNSQVNALIVRAFSNVEYTLALVLLTVFSAVGWYYVLFPGAVLGLAHLIRTGSGVTELAAYLGESPTPLTYGFLGAYFFVAQMLVRRYLSLDLYPSAFLQAAERIIRVLILSFLIGIVAPFNPLWTGFASAFAFLAGVFPPWAQQSITKFLNEKMQTEFPETINRAPLTMLDGVNIWTEARLFEEDVESVQGMATVGIEALIVGTSYPAARIVDWVDQSILLIHCESNPQMEAGLRSASIRGASDVLDAAGLNLLDLKQLAEQDFEPDDAKLKLLLSAMNKASTANGANGAQIDEGQLRELCDVIWPSPNLQYVLSYTSQVAKRLPGVIGAKVGDGRASDLNVGLASTEDRRSDRAAEQETDEDGQEDVTASAA